MQRLFGPASSLLGRLRFAQKFLVVGLVLAVPLAVVAFAYARAQQTSIASSDTERIGLTAMAPIIQLAEDVAVARHAAVSSGHAVAVPAADIAAVDRTQRDFGQMLKTTGDWQEVRQQLVIAGVTRGPATALDAYDSVDIGLESLIVAVGDGSRLTTDPSLDASYLIDLIQQQAPLIFDTTTRIGDEFRVDALSGFPDEVGLRTQVSVALGAINASAATIDDDVETAAQDTDDRATRADLPPLLAPLDTAVSMLDESLGALRFTRGAGAARPAGMRELTRAVDQLTRAATVALERLLRDRSAAEIHRAHLVEGLAALATVAALYLFGAFYLCVAGAVSEMLATLTAVASGRLSERVTVTHRDELGLIAAAINDMVAKVGHVTEQLATDATHDGLTGLPNRSAIIDELQRSLARASDHATVAVLFVDLDGFKLINDSLGHAAGDDVLREVSGRLLATTRPTDTVARLSGDEFVVVCRGLPDASGAVAVAERMLACITPPVSMHGPDGEPARASVGASIGVTFASAPSTTAEQMLGDADVAMYHAKARGRNRVEVFDDQLRADARERQALHEELARAISDNEIRVHYQPIVDGRTAEVRGFEALVRWEHPERGLLAPGSFIAEAESSGLIVALGELVLREACRQLAAWQTALTMPSGLHMSVNLSARQLESHHVLEVVKAASEDAGIDPSSLWLEITETALLTDAGTAAEILTALRAHGFRIALDDFGTGYSSLTHLRSFPLDVIKIDRSFVSGVGVDRGDEAIVRTVTGLARAFGFAVVAEGVETEEQHQWLLDAGCDMAQGYLFGRPAPAPSIGGRSMPVVARSVG